MNTKMLLWSATVATALLAACGGGGGDTAETVLIASSDTVIAAALESASAVEDVPFVFGPVPDFGTTATTTVTFTDASATTPTFSIAAEGNTATGETSFGSCVFKITFSTFDADHRLAKGTTLIVNPCNITVRTAGKVANGVAETRSVALRLGAASSANAPVTVNVNAGGQLTLNGRAAGTITLTPVTGGGS